MGLTWPAGRRQARQPSRPEPARRWALVLTSAAFFMVALDALVVITALPAVHRDLGGSVSTLEWRVHALVRGRDHRFGGVFGVAVVTAVFTATGHLGAPAQVAAGFRPALAVSAGLSVLGAVTALAVTRRRAGPAQAPAAAQPAAHHEAQQSPEPFPLTG